MQQITTIKETDVGKLSSNLDFIYNRFDLIYPSDNILLNVYQNNKMYQIPVHFEGGKAQFGLWLSQVPLEIVCEAAKQLFEDNPKLKTISFKNYLYDVSTLWKNHFQLELNHWSIMLPDSARELDGRLSAKKRYNIKREKRLANEHIEEYEILSFSATEVPTEIIEQYFEFKQSIYGIDYHMTPKEYLTQYYVSHVYILRFISTGRVGAIICSCEQGENVYLENLAYDPSFKRYSLGAILYDEYLKLLIQKSKRSLYLGYGKQVYKSLYGAKEHLTYSGELFRSKSVFMQQIWLPKQKNRLVRKMKMIIKKIDFLNLRSKLR